MALGMKTGGRLKGTPNKATVAAREKLEALGLDPIETMARIALDESLEPALRLNAAKELAQYVCPKLKSSEVAMTNEVVIDNCELSEAEVDAKLRQGLLSYLETNPDFALQVRESLIKREATKD